MASGVIHGRLGALYLSTAAGSTSYGTEIGYTNSWSISPDKELTEVTPLNNDAKDFLEGRIGGSFSMQGNLRIGDSILHRVINRFAQLEIDTDTGGRDTFAEGTFYAHCIVKSIDTSKSSDDIKGAKFVVPILLSGFGAEMNGGDVGSWSAEGTIDGSILYVESTDTERGLPKKA